MDGLRTGAINIGSANSTTTLFGATNCNALQGTLTTGTQSLYANKTGGTLNIANNQTSGSVVIGATGSTLTLNSTTISVGGTTSNIALGALTGAGATTLNKPITIAYPVPTATSQLGYYNASTMIWSTAAGGIITTSPILPVGVYLVSLALATFGTFVKNFVYFESSATGGCAPVNNNIIAFDDSTDRNVCNGNCILNITTGGKFDIKNFAVNAQTLDASATMRIVRLA